MKAVQQQAQQLVAVMLPSVAELGSRRQLGNAPQEVGRIYRILATAVVHRVHLYHHSEVSAQ